MIKTKDAKCFSILDRPKILRYREGPFIEEQELNISDIQHMRNQNEVRVNRKMEPIERLAATGLDQEGSAARKRLVPMVVLIILLRIACVGFPPNLNKRISSKNYAM